MTKKQIKVKALTKLLEKYTKKRVVFKEEVEKTPEDEANDKRVILMNAVDTATQNCSAEIQNALEDFINPNRTINDSIKNEVLGKVQNCINELKSFINTKN